MSFRKMCQQTLLLSFVFIVFSSGCENSSLSDQILMKRLAELRKSSAENVEPVKTPRPGKAGSPEWERIDKMIMTGHKHQNRQDFCQAEKYYREFYTELKKLNEKYSYRNILGLLAKSLKGQGRYQEAIESRKESFKYIIDDEIKAKLQNPQNEPSAYDLVDLAELYTALGDFSKADELFRESEKTARGLGSKDRPGIGGGGGRAAQFGRKGDVEIGLYPQIAEFHIEVGQYNKAIKLIEMSVKGALDDNKKAPSGWEMDYSMLLLPYAKAQFYTGDYQAAEKTIREAVDSGGKKYSSSTMLAKLEEKLGNLNAAGEAYRKAIYWVSPSGNGSLPFFEELADAHNAYAMFLLSQQKLEESKEHLILSNNVRLMTAGDAHPGYADSLRALADIAVMKGDLSTATELCQKSLDICLNSVLPIHPRLVRHHLSMAAIHELNGNSEESSAEFDKALQIIKPFEEQPEVYQAPLGSQTEETIRTLKRYIKILDEKNKPQLKEKYEQYLKKLER